MRPLIVCLAVLALTSSAFAAGFLDSLTAAQKKQMGLNQLSPAQAAAINEAVAHYQAPDAVVAAQRAAEVAVADYKAKQEPVVVARAVSATQQRAAEDRVEKFSAQIIGRFTGWGGGTSFALDNGQVWQQVGSEVYYLSPVENPTVEFRKALSGHFRLYLPDGTWVTVKRVR